MPPALPNGSTAHQASNHDSPLTLRHIPVTFDNADPDRSAKNLVEEYSPSWRTDEGPLKFVRFTDGITNTLTKATKRRPGKSESEIDQDAILIRAYGKGTDVLIDREKELKAHSLLATLGLAPPLLARFDNGIMYRFIQGQPCSPEDLRKPEVYRQVAKRLGEWHGRLPTSAITGTPVLNGVVEHRHCGAKDGKATLPSPNTWTVMQHWIEALPSGTEKERERKKMLDLELSELSARFGATPGLGGYDYIFGHCDLLSGNVIVSPSIATETHADSEEPSVSFIDYEYATPSAAAFDISNHFAEWVGFECDHGKVPTKSQRREFLKHYVTSFRYHSISDADSLTVDIDFQKDIDTLYDQVEQFRGIPGFYWGIWALIQAMISQIDFDYANYAELRFGEYWAWKAEMDGSRAREGKEMPLRERRWAQA